MSLLPVVRSLLSRHAEPRADNPSQRKLEITLRTRDKNLVVEIPTAPPAAALAHFEEKFAHETDCWDVHSTQHLDDRGFVLVDVRSPEMFKGGHLPGAINIPRALLSARRVADFGLETLFVVYCAGPHCNGSTRAAAKLAKMGRPVKEMIGGITGWIDEGFDLVTA